MKPTPEATYERARRIANILCKTIMLQCRRIQTDEPDDANFVFRRWADFEFLINALSRLRRMATLASKVPMIHAEIQQAISEFDKILPDLPKMRNTLEHMDDYALDAGWNTDICRTQLEVGSYNCDELNWLGSTLRIEDAMNATSLLFRAIVESLELLKERITKRTSGALDSAR